MSADSGNYGYLISTQQRFFSAVSGHDMSRRALVVVRAGPACDPSGIRSACDRLIRRNEILRTRYVQLPDRRTPVQVIDETPSVEWIEESHISPVGQLTEAIEAVRSLHSQQREHTTAIVRCSCSQLKTGDFLFALSLPLLSSDRETLSNVAVQLAAEYSGKVQDPEPLQYCDFSEWQYSRLEDSAKDRTNSEEKWKSLLAGSSSGPLLRFEHSSDAANRAMDFQLSEFCIPLAGSIYAAMKALTRKEGVHIREIVFQCWRALLWRYAGQCSDGWLGRIEAGRDISEFRSALGLFAGWNITPLPLERDATLASLLRAPAAGCSVADLEMMCQKLPERKDIFSRSVDFEYQELPNLEESWEVVWQDCQLKPFRIKLDCIENAESLLARLVYPAHSFDRSDIVDFAESFQSLLENAFEHPERSIEALSLIGARTGSVRGCAFGPIASPPPDICDLIGVPAQGSWDDIAVVENERTLTWRQLQTKSSSFAGWLLQQGAKSESVIALVLERSLDAVAILLGILKAGCVYAPIDTSLPPARMRRHLEKIKPWAVISADAAPVDGLPSAKRINLPSGWRWFDSGQMAPEPQRVFDSLQLAYMTFTSGSTGEPKVVGVSRGSIANYTDFIRRQLPADFAKTAGRPRFAMVTTLAADLGNTALFGSLACGGVLHLVSKDVAMDPVLLSEYFETHEINVVKIVPSHLHAFMEVVERPIRSLRWLICGGEVCDWRLLARSRQLFPSAKIMNHYGPTETTVGSLVYPCDPQLAVDERAPCVPIGAPITGTDVLVLNGALEACPHWAPGDVYIAGKGLARGYIGNPDLTAASFVPCHTTTDPSSRMYRTGDIAFTLPTGSLVFLGRKDDQVKLRGYRVELKEVERIMLAYPGVREAFVAVLQSDKVIPRLGACVVSSTSDLSLQALRDHLREQLPEYMVPASLLAVPALPLTGNGKLDRDAITQLLIKNAAAAQAGAGHDLSWIEEIIAGIWKELLGVDRVSSHDNFFDLGGHSLVGTQLIARIREIFRTEIPVRTLFELPVLQDLARAVEESLFRLTSSDLPPIEPASRSGAIPLSFSQQRLWFIEQMQRSQGIYNCFAAVHLAGSLNTHALEQAFLDLIARHEVLRTSFQSFEGTPQQKIHAEIPWRLALENYTDLPADMRMQEAMTAIVRDAAKPFDLTSPPLFRVVLRRLKEGEHILDICIHHIISDAWSMGIMLRDLALFYQQCATRQPRVAPPLSIQYADFAVWQRRVLTGNLLEQQVNYWRMQLQDALTLDLPTDAPRPSLPAGIGAEQHFHFPLELSEQVEAQSREYGLSPFMYLLAAWQLVLARYSNQNDVVVGSPVAGRNYREHEDLIGCFINMLAIRARFVTGMTVRELLEQVREACLGAYANQHLPFENLVSRLELTRDISRTPLFQASFNFHNTPQQPFSLTDLKAEWLPIPATTSRFELELNMWRTHESLRGTLVYDSELFGQPRARRMIAHFINIAQGMAHGADHPLEMLPMMNGSEREQALSYGRSGPAEYPHDRCIHDLFAEVAARFPHNVAVACGKEQLTYRELDDHASCVAQALRGYGVGHEAIVAVGLNRSIDAIVSFLAILKIGAAYLPLDMEQPLAQLEFILADSKVILALVPREYLDRLPISGPQAVCVDDVRGLDANQNGPALGPGSACFPENLAYVMYTSGTIGVPKAVAVNHRGIVRLVKNTNYVTLDDKNVMLQFAFLGFGASTFEIWGALLNGARLEIFAARQWSSRELAAFMTTKDIDTLWLTPPVFKKIVDDEISAFARVRQLVTGGDVVPLPQSRRLLTTYPELALVNVGGSMENSTFTAAYPMKSPAQAGWNRVPMGSPISNTDIYVLDESFEPVPLGVPGELYVGGDGLARGYAGRPELTATAFLPNPHAGTYGARMYRTGDRVHWHEDGKLEFLGRANRVELQGYRIEPREIEAALQSHSSVREALVTTKGIGTEKRLVAFVTPASRARDLNASELQQYLRLRLPAHMMPSSFVEIDEFPLNSSGKHDLEALARLQEIRPAPRSDSTPRTPLEIRIGNVWKDVLGLERISTHESFFEAGGDSLLIVKLHRLLLKELELEISVVDLFRNPTIASLVHWLETQDTESKTARAASDRAAKRKQAIAGRYNVNTPSSLP